MGLRKLVEKNIALILGAIITILNLYIANQVQPLIFRVSAIEEDHQSIEEIMVTKELFNASIQALNDKLDLTIRLLREK